MNRLKQVTASIVFIILAVILFGVYASSAFNKVDVTLGEIQNMMRNQSEDLWNYDPNDLMYTFGGSFSLIRDGDAWKYSGNPNTSCLSENQNEWGTLMGKLRAVIDIDSDGTVYIYSDNYNDYAKPDDVERFNQLACMCELQSTRSSDATNYPSFFFSDIALRNPEYGIDTFKPGTREEYAKYANDALREAQKRWGALPANNRIREGYRMRILVVSYINPNGQNAGQERMFFGEAPYDDDPGPGKLRLIKANSKTDERIPGVQFKIKRTGNNKADTGYIQVIGKFGKNDIIPGSPTPSPSPSATESASAGNSGSEPDFTAPYPGEPGKVYLMNNDSEQEDGDDEKEDRAIPGPITGVGQESDWRIVYTSIEKDATIFETDSNGEIYISGLISGDYVAEEIEGEMSGAFEVVPETTTFKVKKCPDGDVTKGDDSKAVIKNEPITTTVELIKTDMITGEPLNGAGFKLQNTDTGEWVTDPDAKKPQDKLSNDEARAHEFFTDNGRITVEGLPPGNYKWIETTFPTNERTGGKYVALDRDAEGFSVSGGKGETVSVNVQNKPVGLFRKVIKGTDKGIQGIPFEFREYSIADEYPELMEGFTVGGISYKGSLADEHCTYNTCDEVDTKVPHYGVRADGSTYVWYTCSLHNLDGSHADAWEERRAKYNDDVKWANDHHAAREKGVKEINEGTSSGSGSGNNSEDPSSSANPTATTSASPSASTTPSSTPSESASPSASTTPSSTPGESASPSANPAGETSKIKSLLESVCPELFDENGEFYAGITDTEINECLTTDTIISDGNLNWICMHHQNHGTYEELMKHIEEWNKEKDEHNRLVRFANRIYTVKQENKIYTIEELCKDIYPELYDAQYYAGEDEKQFNLCMDVDTLLSSGPDNVQHCVHHMYTGTREGILNHVNEWNAGREEHNEIVKNVNKLLSTVSDKLKTDSSESDEEKESSIKSFFKIICPELFTGDYYTGETNDEIKLCTKDDDVIQSAFTNGLDNFWTCFVHKKRGTHDELIQHREEWIQGREDYNKLVKAANKIYAAVKEGKKYTIREIYEEIYPELFKGDYYTGEEDSKIKLCYTYDKTIVYSDTDTTCTRHDHHTTKQEACLHVAEWNQARDNRNKLVEKLNNMYNYAFKTERSRKRLTSRATSVDGVREVTQVAAASNDGTGESTGGKRNNLTDENGNIDISPLVPDGDDGRGKFQYREIDEGMENPYFNNDHPDWTDFDYLGKTIVEDERRRMDIEGLIWVERSQDQKGGIDDPETVNGIYDEGLDQLLYPVEVCLKHNDQVIGQGVITTDGRYRIRVGGKDGADIKYVTTEKEGTYVEFTYNGMKYQSVWPATLEDEENGSKAMETKDDRQTFNEKYSTITSNNGDAMTNRTADGTTIINYEKLEDNGEYAYKRRVLYEGKVEGLFDGAESETFGGRDSDPIGDGVYSGLQKRPKANEIDTEYTIQQATNGDTSIYSDNVYTYSSKTGGDKYQIKADTQTAGYQGIMNYKVEDDKIEHVNLGVYERIQPDLSVVNDIERVKLIMNDESYVYQYGGKTANIEDVYSGGVFARFQNNVNYKYKRPVKPELIQVEQEKQNDHDGDDPFRIRVYYKTTVRNESSYVSVQPEMRTQFDSDYWNVDPYDIDDATDEVYGSLTEKERETITPIHVEWKKEANKPYGNNNTGNNLDEAYKQAYGMLERTINPGETVTFYTAYTLTRDNMLALVEGTQEELNFYNNIEVNAYTTTWEDDKGQERKETGPAYAGIDVDSAAGNSKPTIDDAQGSIEAVNDTFEDDNDFAPTFQLLLQQAAQISGNVFEDAASEAKAGDRAAGELMTYLGDGIKDEKTVQNVKVELVELDKSGEEILNDDGSTKVLLGVQEEKGGIMLPKGDEVAPAVTYTEENGNYNFAGFIPGEYVVKFTWGQDVDGNASTADGKTLYVQQYKSTTFNDEQRYANMVNKGNSSDGTTKNRWYLKTSGIDYQGKSNAVDDMVARKKIDDEMLNTGNNYDPGDDITYPDLEEPEVFGTRDTKIASRTPAFDVNFRSVDVDSDNTEDKLIENFDDSENGIDTIKVDGLDFGIVKRPKQQMDLEKRIERVSIKLANGQTLIDANVNWKETPNRMKIEDIKGEIAQVAYPKDSVNESGRDMGTFKMEIDKEILQGSTMEITYRYNIVNESNLDYVVSNEKQQDGTYNPYTYEASKDLNKYYKFGEQQDESEEVTMSPSIIIDYLDNSLSWKKSPEVDYHENDLWEEITKEENNSTQRITNLLYDGRFKEPSDNVLYTEKVGNTYNNYTKGSIVEQLDNIYKFYRTILRDTSAENSQGKIYLKAKEISKDDVKFIASKELSDTNVDLDFYNSVEIAQLNRTGGAIPESQIPGDSDPSSVGHKDSSNENWKQNGGSSTNYTYTVEHDGGWASLVTITPPTGDSTNYNYIVWTAIGIAALAILGIGTLGIKKVLVPSKVVEPKEDSKENK